VVPGVYKLLDGADQAGVVQISGSSFTVDFHGAKLVGPRAAGVGVKITDAKNVTIRNADVSGYLWGIVLERCSGVRLIHCVSSRNADLAPGTVIDESGTGPEDTHGGGFVLRDCNHCLVQKCTAQRQWDGIDVVRSTNNTIEDGDYSFNGNWGLHLWTSSNNTFRRNRAIWCTTGSGLLYQSLSGWQTYDSQAVGIDHNSNENTIADNDLRFGGDAIFIRANEGGQTPGHPVPVKNGSNRNRLLNNDCSFSPNNAIEVDFVEDTVIEGNNCSCSNYGLWLGYSVRSVCRNNICVNDSTHAVEIENGQNGVFERNVFGWDTQRPNGQLVLLRQNGNDKTPSGPYSIKNNLFYGAGVGVQLANTSATLAANYLGNLPQEISSRSAHLVDGDDKSLVDAAGTEEASDQIKRLYDGDEGGRLGEPIIPGSDFVIAVPGYQRGDPPPVIELGGVPAWIRKLAGGTVSVRVPMDNWLLPAPQFLRLDVRTARGGRHEYNILHFWVNSKASQPTISAFYPNPARIGDNITVNGPFVDGGRFLLNGKIAEVVSHVKGKTVLKAPEGILTPTHYNLVWEKGEGADRVATWPIVITVDVPAKQMPHLVSASFSPTTVRVGELLKVTMTVRNNLPVPAGLTMIPKQPFSYDEKLTYDEKEAWYEKGYGETPGCLNLRVSTDFFVGGHHPGSWPWMFGFDNAILKPGETTTVTGYVRLQTPGSHMFRIGLVAGGSRFIDDNAYQTKITVVP
jgi:parallel beta-helix repeat protein